MLMIHGFKSIEKKCAVCGEVLPLFSLIRVEKFGYVCNRCADKVEDYSTKNDLFLYKPNKKNRTFSTEFETSSKHPDCLILRKYGYIPTHDGSISGFEWKSPVYQNKRGLKKGVLKVMDGLQKYVGSDCGTHLHIGTLTGDDRSTIRNYSSFIFGELVEYLERNEGETERVWGRYFNSYCSSDFSDGRYQAFSAHTGSSPTLEYRLPKFINSDQFYNLINCCTDLTDVVLDGIADIRKNNGFDRRTTAQRQTIKLGEKVLEKYMQYV